VKEAFSRLELLHFLEVFSNKKVELEFCLHWNDSNACGTSITIFFLFLYVNEHFLKVSIVDIYV